MKKEWWIGLVIIVVVGAVIVKTELDKINAQNPSLVMQPSGKVLPDFVFDIAGEQTFTNQNLLDHWTLFFIGYTFCPDVCPTTLADLDRVYPELSKPPYDNLQIVFVSADPNRDKADNLAEYVHYFNEKFIGTTSTHEALYPFSQDLGLMYSIVEEGDTADPYYLIDHSASLVLVNSAGEHHATFKAVLNAQGVRHVDMDLMVKDIHRLIDEHH